MRIIAILALLFSGFAANAQLFVGAAVQGGITTSTNSSQRFRAGQKVPVAPMWSANISVQYRYKWAWLESGFGAFTGTKSHNLAGMALHGDYERVNERYHYWNIPLKIGAVVAMKRGLTLQPYAGVNYLVEPTNFGRRWDGSAYYEEVPLKTKTGSREKGSYILLQDEFSWTAPLACAGLRVEKKLSKRGLLQAGVEFNFGFKVLQSNALFATEDNGGGVVRSNFASNKGDCIGLTVGYAHRIF